MHTCNGAICGLRRVVAGGLGPASMGISLTFGTWFGVPDAADSACRFVSCAPEALLDEKLFMAHNPCSADGMGGATECYDTTESNKQQRRYVASVRNGNIDAFPRSHRFPAFTR